MGWKTERGEVSRALWWMLCWTTQISTLDEGTQSASSYEGWLQIPHSCIPLRRCLQLKEAACIQYTSPAAPVQWLGNARAERPCPLALHRTSLKGHQHQIPVGLTEAGFSTRATILACPRTEVSVLNWDSPAWSITLFAAAPQFNFSSRPNLFHLLSEMLPLPPKNSP